jgi:hypothetical protein
VIARAASAWDRVWFAPTQAHSLAAFRIGFGLLWIVITLSSLPNWMRFYGRDGIVPFSWLGDPFFARPSLLSVSASDQWTWAFFVFTLAAAICFTVGYRTRVATIALYLTVISMVNRTPTVTHGEDLVSRPLLFFACFASLGDAWSVDAWLRSRRGAPAPAAGAIWPLRMMQISVAFVYLFSLPAKPSDDRAWIDGTALYYVMASENWSRFPHLATLFAYGPLTSLLTVGTLVVEGAFPFLVWWSRTRWIALGSLAALQVGIAVLVGHVFNFNVVMLASFLLFVPDEALARTVGRAGAAVRQLRRGRIVDGTAAAREAPAV